MYFLHWPWKKKTESFTCFLGQHELFAVSAAQLGSAWVGQDMELRDEKKAGCEGGDTRSIKTCT